MYSVSAEYISAMSSAIQRHKIIGNIDGKMFYSADVLKGSMTLSNQCSDSSDLSIGAVYIGTLKFTLLSDLGFNRGSWKGRTITLRHAQLINEADELWETIPVGVYTISEANHSEKGIEITAYDNMAKLDIVYPNTTVNGSVYDVLNFICTRCAVEFANTRTEVEAMPNGDAVLGVYPENNCSTWRDLAHYAAQIVGGFLTANREGKIELRRFGNASGFTVDTTRRLTGSKFSDFITNYTSVSVENIAEKTTRTIKLQSDDGIRISLGQNPLLQYGTTETLETMLGNILTEINGIKYTPFNSSMVGNPAFDLGDVITYTGGTAGTSSSCCLMSYTWKFGSSYSVNGFGKNPSIAGAQSKAEKAASGASASSKADKIVHVTYQNASVTNVSSTEQRIVELHAANVSNTFVEFWVELKMNVTASSQAVLEFRYTVDGVEELYKPVMTFNHSGTYTYSLHYYWQLEEVLQHTFNVYLKVSGGSVQANIGDIHAILIGQGLASEAEWDGKVDLEDSYSLARSGGKSINFADQAPDVVLMVPEQHSITDAWSLDNRRMKSINFTDVPEQPIITNDTYNLITEDESRLITEDDNPIITEGGNS